MPGAIHVGKEYLYVAGYGSSRVGVFKRSNNNEALLPVGTIALRSPGEPNAVNGMGPAGIVELPSGVVVILSRLDNTLHVFSPETTGSSGFSRLQTVTMFSPESADIVQGRRFLYDADSAGNGKVACASCHIFGDTDGLAWDLGSLDAKLVINKKEFIDIPGALVQNMANTVRALPLSLSPDNYVVGDLVPVGSYQLPLCFKGPADQLHQQLKEGAFGIRGCVLYVTEAATTDEAKSFNTWIMGAGSSWASVNVPYFHALKGPMGTQTLFGLVHGGAMHHRGDRTGSEPSANNHCPEGNSLVERAFKEFNQSCDAGGSSFDSLLGGRPLAATDMDAFARFALNMHFPPNPHRALDNHVPKDWQGLFSTQKIAKDITDRNTMLPSGTGITSCSHCHKLDPVKGFFGTSDAKYYSAPHVVSQDMDVPDFRVFYRKLGLYITDYRNYFSGDFQSSYVINNKQLSGFGYFHNAALDAVNATFNPLFFRYPADQKNSVDSSVFNYDIQSRKKLFYFLSSFDTDVFPAGGQQRHAGDSNVYEVSGAPREYCRLYGFNEAKFFEGYLPANSRDAVMTCYPVLQATEGRQ